MTPDELTNSTTSSSIGNRPAVCTRDTSVEAFGSSTSSHWAPTVCIQVPIMLPSWASHSARNAAIRNGDHAEPSGTTLRSAGDGSTHSACPPHGEMALLLPLGRRASVHPRG